MIDAIRNLLETSILCGVVDEFIMTSSDVARPASMKRDINPGTSTWSGIMDIWPTDNPCSAQVILKELKRCLILFMQRSCC